MSVDAPEYLLEYNRKAWEVLRDPSTSFWLKNAIKDALARDCVDAADDAKVLAEILLERANEILAIRGTNRSANLQGLEGVKRNDQGDQ